MFTTLQIYTDDDKRQEILGPNRKYYFARTFWNFQSNFGVSLHEFTCEMIVERDSNLPIEVIGTKNHLAICKPKWTRVNTPIGRYKIVMIQQQDSQQQLFMGGSHKS